MLGQQPELAPVSEASLSAAKEKYAWDGYCIIPGVLSPSEVAQVRQRIVEQAAAEKALGWAREDAGPTQLKKILEHQGGALISGYVHDRPPARLVLDAPSQSRSCHYQSWVARMAA
ncbi:phytanoyl-CoA dioxygenase family protein [Bradyrhizobium sp. 186]|uniref:phytanoyl-CoA dioxygenase family protein n=1 Tax=Bradyrhizobium sp. 186 TaxID=2782654 RepID=UPI0020017759|nr:phytanoyl-CoA dioxygenase family protein [Bradyrhizobium sp. 186]UPK34458.1 phytanoyl-CoA dioxygenase family protein [Bradyrhizobium sp. 186]